MVEYWNNENKQKSRKIKPDPSVVRQKSLSFVCHSGLDPESSIYKLDSRFRGNDSFGFNVKKRWTHYASFLISVRLHPTFLNSIFPIFQ